MKQIKEYFMRKLIIMTYRITKIGNANSWLPLFQLLQNNMEKVG